MVEALVLALAGTLLGVAWSTLGIYLGSLIISDNPQAAYAIRGAFLAIAMMFHGFLRSRTPRLFIFVLLVVIVSVVLLVSSATVVTPVLATQILYPILIAVGVIVLVNLCIFPEFSSNFLGHMTVETLSDTTKALEDAGRYFTYTSQTLEGHSAGKPKVSPKTDHTPITKRSPSEWQASRTLSVFKSLRKIMESSRRNKERSGSAEVSNLVMPRMEESHRNVLEESQIVSLGALITAKGKLRTQLLSCRVAQRECNFEVAVSVLPPQNMKPISVSCMKKLVANTIALISACESKYALLGGLGHDKGEAGSKPLPDGNVNNSESERSSGKGNKPKTHKQNISAEKTELDLVKPRREIEFGDVQLLRYLLQTVKRPYEDLQGVITRTVDVVSACIAYTYVRILLSIPF